MRPQQTPVLPRGPWCPSTKHHPPGWWPGGKGQAGFHSVTQLSWGQGRGWAIQMPQGCWLSKISLEILCPGEAWIPRARRCFVTLTKTSTLRTYYVPGT